MLVLEVGGCLPAPLCSTTILGRVWPLPTSFVDLSHLTTSQHWKRATTCLFLMLVGSAPHHPPALKMSMSLLVFDVGGLRTSPCHLTIHQHQKWAHHCSFLMLVGSAPHYHLTTTHHHRKWVCVYSFLVLVCYLPHYHLTTTHHHHWKQVHMCSFSVGVCHTTACHHCKQIPVYSFLVVLCYLPHHHLLPPSKMSAHTHFWGCLIIWMYRL